MQTALQTLIDGGLHEDKVRDICDDIVRCDESERWAVLLAYLLDDGQNVKPDDIDEIGYRDNAFSANGGEWLVLTDEEADTACGEYIEDSLWMFNANYLSGLTRLPCEVFEALQGECEESNDAVRAIIDGSCGIDDFVNNAIGDDGRGSFLGQWNGEEYEVCIDSEYYYIYRIN